MRKEMISDADAKSDCKPSVLQQILLCSALFANEVSVTYQLVYMIIVQKWLGLPTRYLSVSGMISAPLSTLLIPLLGKLGDGPSYTSQQYMASMRIKRKSLLVVLVGSFHVIAASLLVIASVMELNNIAKTDNIPNNASAKRNEYKSSFLDEWQKADSLLTRRIMYNHSIMLDTRHNRSMVNELPDKSVILHDRTTDTIPYLPNVSNYSSSISIDENSAQSTADFHEDLQNAEETILTKAILGVVAFTLMDVGFDVGSSNYRAYVLECVDNEHHEQILWVGVIVAGLGGVLMGAVSVLDYGSMLNISPVILRWYRNIGICIFIIITTLITVPVTVLCGMGLKRQMQRDKEGERGTAVSGELQGIVDNHSGITDVNELIAESSADRIKDHNTDRSRKTCMDEPMTSPVSQLVVSKSSWRDQCGRGVRALKMLFTYKRYTMLLLVCLITFFSNSCALAFEIYLDNFLSECVYGQNGSGETRMNDTMKQSENAAGVAVIKYERGVASTSVGMLIFQAAFFVYNSLHPMVARWLGLTGEYLFFSILIAPFLFLTAFAKSLPVFYVASALCGFYSNIMFMSPFVWTTEKELEKVSNNIEKERLLKKYQMKCSEKFNDMLPVYSLKGYNSVDDSSVLKRDANMKPQATKCRMKGKDCSKSRRKCEGSVRQTKADGSKEDDNDGCTTSSTMSMPSFDVTDTDSEPTGFTISLVSAMFPFAYFVQSVLMGPLLEITDNAAMPIYYGAGAGAATVLVTICLALLLRGGNR